MVGGASYRPHRPPIQDQQHLHDGRLVLVAMRFVRELHGGFAAVVQQPLQARHLAFQVFPVGLGDIEMSALDDGAHRTPQERCIDDTRAGHRSLATVRADTARAPESAGPWRTR